MPNLDQFKAKYAPVAVVASDSLWMIAQKHDGNGARYPKITAANLGDVLVVPE